MSGVIEQIETDPPQINRQRQKPIIFWDNLDEINLKYVDRYICIQCDNMVRIPVKQLYCGHSICSSCVSEARKLSKRCPGLEPCCLETDLDDETHVIPAFQIERQLRVAGFTSDISSNPTTGGCSSSNDQEKVKTPDNIYKQKQSADCSVQTETQNEQDIRMVDSVKYVDSATQTESRVYRTGNVTSKATQVGQPSINLHKISPDKEQIVYTYMVMNIFVRKLLTLFVLIHYFGPYPVAFNGMEH